MDSTTDTMRNLVSIRTIDSLTPIKGADRIEVAHLGGWQCVVHKGLYQEGDKVLYFEIDSFLPHPDSHPEMPREFYKPFESFLERTTKNAFDPATGKKVKGHPVKTIRLRKTLSQGVVIPPEEFYVLGGESSQEFVTEFFNKIGLFKYDPFFNPSMPGQRTLPDNLLPFPSQARKTDSIRVQNVDDDFLRQQKEDNESYTDGSWFATEKLDGTSSTFVKTKDGEFICASRNYTVLGDSIQSDIAQKYDLEANMPNGSVIQGEIVGPGIQGNPLDLDERRLYIFSYHVDESARSETDLANFCEDFMVPRIDLEFPGTVKEAIDQVDGMMSTINPKAISEGVVWWDKYGIHHEELNDRPNFKAINNQFLLKH